MNRRKANINNLNKTKEIKMSNTTTNQHTAFMLSFFVIAAMFVLNTPEAMAVANAPDAGLTAGVTDLLLILNNKLTPVILVAGCIASLVYSFAISQPKPFLLALVTLTGFGFARAWINGTYALIA